MRTLPNERRNFVHRRIGRALSGFVRGGPLGAASGFVSGGGGGASSPVPAGCPPGFAIDASGACAPQTFGPAPGVVARVQRLLPGGKTGLIGFGDAVLGQYGAGLEPAVVATDTRRCPRGSVLGTDGLCYNKRDLKNSERMWPRGRRPLLTGGDMRCISIAAAAAKKLERKTKQLQSLGLMKKPASRRKAAAVPGHHQHQAHD